MNDALLTVLKEYGLNQKEAMIYLVLLELGKAPASSVARQTGLKRVTAYAIVQEMMRKGVVQEIDTKGVKMFAVVDPERLHAQWEVQCKAFASALPEFAALADVRGNKPRMQYFEGFKGVCEIYDDMLTSKEDIRAFVGVDSVTPEMKETLNKNHVKKRVTLGIKANVISSPTNMGKEYHSRDEEQLRETRMMKGLDETLENEISIYGPNRVAFVLYSGDEMSGIIVQSERLYYSLKTIFNFIWNQLDVG